MEPENRLKPGRYAEAPEDGGDQDDVVPVDLASKPKTRESPSLLPNL